MRQVHVLFSSILLISLLFLHREHMLHSPHPSHASEDEYRIMCV